MQSIKKILIVKTSSHQVQPAASHQQECTPLVPCGTQKEGYENGCGRHYRPCPDLNFCYFENNFLEPILTPSKDDKDLKEKLARTVYPVHLTFTDGFLQNPIHNGAQSFMDSIDKGVDREYSFYYVIHPIPHKYVDSLRLTFNNLVFEKACKPGPELAKLMSDVGEKFNSGEITIPGTDAIEGRGAESIKIPLEEPMEWVSI